MKELTIIIPHYNSSETLKTLLDSIPTSDKIQVLVIDDKSIKGIENYNKLKCDRIYNYVTFMDNTTEKKGAGACRNIGLENAIGNWILFADADDFFIEGWYAMIEPYLSMDYDVVFFEPISIFLDSKQECKRHLGIKRTMDEYRKDPNSTNELALRYKISPPWCKLICRKFIEANKITFDNTLVSNDVMFSTKIGYYMRKFTLASTIPFYCTTRSKGSLTMLVNQEVFSVRMKVFLTQVSYLKRRLQAEDFKQLDNSGIQYIAMAIRYDLGIRVILRTYITLRKNHIRVWRSEWWNPICFLKALRNSYYYHKENKKYIVKE